MATTDEPRLTLKPALKQYTGSPNFDNFISFGDNGDIELIYKKRNHCTTYQMPKNLILVRSNRFLKIPLLE